MDSLLEQFLLEARENLSFLDKHLDELKDGNAETLNALFRSAHTLKGGAGLVGFEAVKKITHVAEDVLDAYKKGQIEFSDKLLDTLYDAFDEVVELIDAVEEMGSLNIVIDNDRIEEIKNEVISLLNSSEDKKEELEIPFNIDKNLSIVEFFSFSQISKFIPNIPIKSPAINENLLNNDKTLWLMEMDLESDILELEKEPIHSFYSLNIENLKAFSVKTMNCEDLENNPLEWESYIVSVISGNISSIKSSFSEFIDTLRFYPLSIEKLFDTTYESEDNILLDEFRDELLLLYKEEEFSLLSEKLSAVIQIVNNNSREGFILNLLIIILPNFDIHSDEYKNILSIAIEKLNWDFNDDVNVSLESELDVTPNNSIIVSKNLNSIDEVSKNSALNILNTQLRVLELSNDESLLGRTKLLLSNVLGFIDLDDGVAGAKSIEELKGVIKNKISFLSGNTLEQVEKKVEKIEPVEVTKPIEVTKKVETENERPIHHQNATPKTVKIEQYQIDDLMDMVGELLVIKNSIPYIANNINSNRIEESRRELIATYESINRLSDKLQDRVMEMRLLPLDYIFGRYPKLVRDLSKRLNKKISYEESGGDIKLDKTVIEKLADPLVHIIRNSIDHGIESENERISNGKDSVGIIKISAISEGDRVFLTIEDDGRGVDEEKIVKKAIELGVIDSEEVDSMTKEDRLKLLFTAGLSTKEEVTEVSGRGVGTDAVKTIIEELGGDIHIESEIGKGTKTIFELPLSVALTNVFHIKMSGVNYAIPMDNVIETKKVHIDDIKTATHKPFIKIRNELIPLLFEVSLLNRDKPNNDEICLVVVKNRNKKFGLVVDDFVGQLNVVQKPLGGAFIEHPFITGSSLLGNGEVLFVIEPKNLVELH